MKEFIGHIKVTKGDVFLCWYTDSVLMMAREENKKFFVRYSPYYKRIEVYKMNKNDEVTKQKVAKSDREYYTNIFRNFILANTNFDLTD